MNDKLFSRIRDLRTKSNLLAADFSRFEIAMNAALVDPNVDLSEVLLFPLSLRGYSHHLFTRRDTACNTAYIRAALAAYCLGGNVKADLLSKEAFANHFLETQEGQLANRIWDAADVSLISSCGNVLFIELFVRHQEAGKKLLAAQMFWLPAEKIDAYRTERQLEGGLRHNLLGSPDQAFTAMVTVDVAASPLRTTVEVLDTCLGTDGRELPGWVDTARLRGLKRQFDEAKQVVEFYRYLSDHIGFAVMEQPEVIDEWMLQGEVTGWRDV